MKNNNAFSVFTAFICFLLLLFCSCGDNDDESNQTCNINNIAKNDNIEFGYLDENNVFHSALAFIQDTTVLNIENLGYMKYSQYGYSSTIKMTIKKIKFNGEEIYKNIFHYFTESNNCMETDCIDTVSLIYHILCDIWFTDNKYCKELPTPKTTNFFVYGETDSNYIFTTQIVVNGKIYGNPIFFIDDNYFDIVYYGGKSFATTTVCASQSGYFNIMKIAAKPSADSSDYQWEVDTIGTIIKWGNALLNDKVLKK